MRAALSDTEAPRFTAPEERARRLAALVATLLPEDADGRVLDLGCGTGRPALLLAGLRPHLRILGLDLSAESVAAGLDASVSVRDRIDFVAADYTTWEPREPFDTIYSEGVLHLVPGSDAALAARLARHLKPGGRLLLVMPHACGYNRALVLARRLLRRLRAPALDRAILGLARLLHPDWPAEMLRERLPYVYHTPERLWSAGFAAALAAAGFRVERETGWPQESAGKLSHRAVLLRRAA